MFDPVEAFASQFTPVNGGYVYYPSRRSGGRLVTADEYRAMLENWEHKVQGPGRWKSIGLVVLAIFILALLSPMLALPEWVATATIACVAIAYSAWVWWAALAPRRLVRDRPDHAPPRQASEIRRQARAMLNWPTVILGLLAFGTLFIDRILTWDGTLSRAIGAIGSGLLFAVFIWATIEKLRDRFE